MDDISLHLHRNTCEHRHQEDDCQAHHPNIETCTASIQLSSSDKMVGHIYLNIFHQAAMNQISPIQMWYECQVYDERHLGAKLDKVENYLANESFPSDRDLQIKEAAYILFIDEVVLDPAVRGRGRGLVAVRMVIDELELSNDAVILLQAEPVGGNGSGRPDAGERIAKHWKKLGFCEWSESDESWLCLILGEMERQ